MQIEDSENRGMEKVREENAWQECEEGMVTKLEGKKGREEEAK